MSHSKYVFVFLEIFTREGGIQSYIKDVLRAYCELLEEKKVPPAEVFILRDSAGCSNPLEGVEGLSFRYYGKGSIVMGRLNFSLSLLSYLVWSRPEKVFCGHIKLAKLTSLFCQALRIEYNVLTYGKEVWSPLSSLERKALKESKCIWTISRYSQEQLCLANQIQPNQVRILPCAVDEKKFTRGEKSLELTKKYGLEGAKVIMTVARLWSGDIYKGVDVTIRALSEISEVIDNVKYIVIGRGDDLPRLKQLATDLGISEDIIFAGFIASEELVEHYRLADIYSMPSQEGFGIVYLEAMACGCPVIAGDADGSADPLQDGRLGWRVPHRSPQAVASACIEIFQGQDPRCNALWLREETIKYFSQKALKVNLEKILE